MALCPNDFANVRVYDRLIAGKDYSPRRSLVAYHQGTSYCVRPVGLDIIWEHIFIAFNHGDSITFPIPQPQKMLDPFLTPPPFLSALAVPIASFFNLTTLPLHIHEIVLAFTFYHLVNSLGSPYVSRLLFPNIYPSLNARTKTNWDVHVVSLVQSCLINVLALWVMWKDEERGNMDWEQRVWGYTGGGGMIQGLAAGYFLWDLCVSVTNIQIFGWGLLAHAIAALIVFSIGFVRNILLERKGRNI